MRASPAYVAACGVLMAQYTLTGFDASAHLSEETRNASWSAPMGVITSIGISAIFGFFLLLALLFSIQDFTNTVGTTYGQPVTQILVDVFGTNGAIVLMTLILLCMYHFGFSVSCSSVSSSSKREFRCGSVFEMSANSWTHIRDLSHEYPSNADKRVLTYISSVKVSGTVDCSP